MGVVAVLCLYLALSSLAQSLGDIAATAFVPPVIQFSSVAVDDGGAPLNGTIAVTFSLYNSARGGLPLWSETQNVSLDSSGHYSVYLGLTKSSGVPATLFTTGQAHWLGVRIGSQLEQPRVFLVSVPYAMKAGDAHTLGGLPASAFVLAAPQPNSSVVTAGESAATPTGVSQQESDVTTDGGTINTLPLWSTTTDIESSIVTQTGSGTTGKIGINTGNPGATLDVNGTTNVRGSLTLPATGTATATAGKNSQPQDFIASVFNSSTSTAVAQKFQWQAEPAGNDTVTASGSLNLLYGSGTTAPSETGLSINSSGVLTFGAGQTFPGTGTVTNVASGAGLTGGPITGSGTLRIATGGVTNAMLQNSSVKVVAGTGLTGGGAVALGGTTTLSLSSAVPTLAANNAFTGSNSFKGTQRINGALGINEPPFAAPFQVSGAGLITGEFDNTTQTARIRLNGKSGSGGDVIYQANGTSLFGVYSIAPNTLGFYPGDGSSASMFINNGYVGIGTTTPAAMLEVAELAQFDTGIVATGIGSHGNLKQFAAALLSGGADLPFGNGGGPGLVASGGSSNCTQCVGIGGDGIDVFAGLGNALNGYAGYFTGTVEVAGNLSKSSGSFKIDHPLAPADKYLYHSFVESPDMMNIYNGNVMIGAGGEATVDLPEWFGTLNRDFGYQLTCVGGFAPVYVAEEITNNRFRIAGGKPGLKFSWQVTGIRQDAWANAHRIPVEEAKPERERGYYIHPELYGAPEEKQIEWARHPEVMKRMEEQQEKQSKFAEAKKP